MAPSLPRRGSAAAVTVLSLGALLGFVAMSTDWGAVYTGHTSLQAASDAAAVAAAGALPDLDAVRRRARAYAARIEVHGEPVRLEDGDIEVGVWDGATFTPTHPDDADVVRVTARAPVPTPLAARRGVDAGHPETMSGAGAVLGGPAPDLVIVQDVSGSFSREFPIARQADLSLLQCIRDRAADTTRIGVVTFSGFEENQLAPDGLVTLDEGYSRVRKTIDGLDLCGRGDMLDCAGTNIAAGLWEALRLLDGSESEAEIGRAAVLVSDGAPYADRAVCERETWRVREKYKDKRGRTRYRWVTRVGDYATDAAAAYCPGWKDRPNDRDLERAALDLREEFQAAGYDLHTVFYNERSDGKESRFMQDMVAGRGVYLESPDPTDLPEMLDLVCRAHSRSRPGLVF